MRPLIFRIESENHIIDPESFQCYCGKKLLGLEIHHLPQKPLYHYVCEKCRDEFEAEFGKDSIKPLLKRIKKKKEDDEQETDGESD